MMKKLFILSVFVSVLIFGCDDGSAKNDADIILIADEDLSDDLSDEILTDSEENDSDQDEITDDPAEIINIGLDESFLEPSKGFTFKIVSPLLPSAPSSYELKPEEKPYFLKGELIDKSGNKFTFSNIDNTFAANYEGYLYITSASEYLETTYYTANILPSFETLDWMVENEVDTVNSTYFYLYLYRNDFVDDTLFRVCPDAIPDPAKESALKLFMDENEWNFNENFGIMVNTYLTFDKKAITTFFGDELHKLCYCYDIDGNGNPTERACTPEDMDLDPLPPTSPTPEDGAENVDATVELSWKASSDPDGGAVKYTLLFGTDSVPADKVLENSSDLKWKPEKPLDLNTQYFWQVIVTDDEENEVKGKIWTFNTDETVVTLEAHDFLILVNSTLKGKLDDELNQYIQDVESAGYTPAIRYWMPGGAEIMKEIVKKSYDEHSITGAVFIGDLPPASFEQFADYGEPYGIVYEEFPSEFFFMDMDGDWEDSDTNGIYDKYPKDLTLEIFSSRIIGTVKEISDYLGRTHEYRKNGSFFDSRNFFSFIDDDWSTYIDESGKVWEDYMGIKNSLWELGSIYGDNYERREDPENTTKTTYMDFLTKDGAEYVYQWIHSDPQKIYFDDNFSPNPANILTIEEIINGKVKGSFYNLFDCSISRYTAIGGNIASEYLKGEYGLATLGSTKTGGIFNPEVMNIALANGENWGTGYQMWVNDIWENHENYGFDHAFIESWWLGMMIQGDPLLTLTDKKNFTVKSTYPKKVYTLEQLRMLNRIKSAH
ncbi:MAG TPA: C25 family cysteine peptidase [bacterium]|nr:C25 family cysteine peptidase [bacterium]